MRSRWSLRCSTRWQLYVASCSPFSMCFCFLAWRGYHLGPGRHVTERLRPFVCPHAAEGLSLCWSEPRRSSMAIPKEEARPRGSRFICWSASPSALSCGVTIIERFVFSGRCRWRVRLCMRGRRMNLRRGLLVTSGRGLLSPYLQGLNEIQGVEEGLGLRARKAVPQGYLGRVKCNACFRPKAVIRGATLTGAQAPAAAAASQDRSLAVCGTLYSRPTACGRRL